MKKFLPHIIVALIGFLLFSFIYKEVNSFGFPFSVYDRIGTGICTRSYPPQCENYELRLALIYILYDVIFWFVAAFSLVNLYKEVKNNTKKLIMYSIVAIIGFLTVSFAFDIYYRTNSFGLPFPIYTVPFDCMFSVPRDCYEGFLWQGILFDIFFWPIISFILVKLFVLIKKRFVLNIKLAKTVFIVSIILGVILLVFIGISSMTSYMGQQATCGGFEGKVCPIGYFCPNSRYPDELKQCISLVEFLKRR